MSYFKTVVKLDRPEKVIDLPRFAAELAPLVGGTVEPAGEYPDNRQLIRIGADTVDLYADNWKKRINVSIEASDLQPGDLPTYRNDSMKSQSATVSPDRPIERIAKDIKRRVIDGSQPALKAQREYAAQQRDNRAAIVREADALKAACPGLDIKVNEREQSAAIWGRAGLYLNASMTCTGSVSIQRMESVSRDLFAKIVALLEAEKGGSR